MSRTLGILELDQTIDILEGARNIEVAGSTRRVGDDIYYAKKKSPRILETRLVATLCLVCGFFPACFDGKFDTQPAV